VRQSFVGFDPILVDWSTFLFSSILYPLALINKFRTSQKFSSFTTYIIIIITNLNYICIYIKFYFFGGARIWTHGFRLAKQMLYHLNHASGPFCSGYFGERSLTNSFPRVGFEPQSSQSQPPK
jgi:hypothetical protein